MVFANKHLPTFKALPCHTIPSYAFMGLRGWILLSMELGSIERRPPPERMGGITNIFAGGGARLEFVRGTLTGAPPVTDGTIVQTDEAGT